MGACVRGTFFYPPLGGGVSVTDGEVVQRTIPHPLRGSSLYTREPNSDLPWEGGSVADGGVVVTGNPPVDCVDTLLYTRRA